jgi:predicted phage terminase large subunit-like protein
LTPEQKQKWKTARHRARTDLFWLAKEVLGYKDLNERVHRPICDLFVKKDSKRPLPEQDALKKRLLLDPRGHFKTTLDECDVVQWLLNFPDIRVNVMTGTLELAKRMIGNLKRHFQENDKMRTLFPEYCVAAGKDFGAAFGFTLPNRRVTNLREPSVSVSTIESGKTGSHYDVIKCDDLVTELNAATQEQLQKVIDQFEYVWKLIEPYGYVDVIGTRYDHSDLYGHILDINEGDWRVHMRKCGVLAPDGKSFTKLLFPERFTSDWLMQQRKSNPYIFNCFPQGAPVLMADWSEKPIEQLRLGDKIVGYKLNRGRWELTEATVQHVHKEEGEVIRATTSAGREIFCTPDHKFFQPKKRATHPYRPLKVGCSVVSVCNVSPPQSDDEQRDLDWLGGILDGEGSVNGSVMVAQSKEANPVVCKEIRDTLERLRIPFQQYENFHLFALHGGRSLKMRLLRHARMAKRQRFSDHIWSNCRRVAENGGVEKIVTIRPDGHQAVYNIQSSTGNFVCYGFATKNCQYLNDPTPTDNQSFTPELIEGHIIPHAHIPRNGRVFITWDLGFSKKEYADFSVGAVGLYDEQGRLFILDADMGRFSPYELVQHFFNLLRKWRPARVGIEKAGGSELLEPALVHYAREHNIHLPLDWMPTNPNTRKVERIAGLEALLRQDKLFFSAAIPCRDELMKQFTRFPRFKHDDIPDAVSMLLTYRSAIDIAWPADKVEMGGVTPMPGCELLGAGLCG